MNNNQLVNVVKSTAYTKLVFDNGCELRVNGADPMVEPVEGDELISIFPAIREQQYRVLYSSPTLDKHGTSNATELLDYWEQNGFFLPNGNIVADDRVEYRGDLPIGIGNPLIGAIYLVEKPTTILFGAYTTYQSGLYIKDNDTGSLNDWRRLNIKLKFTDGEYYIVSSLDQSKQVKYDVTPVTTGTTRVLTVQDKDGTIALSEDVGNIKVDITANYTLPTILGFGNKLLILSNRSGDSWILSAFGSETIEGVTEVTILNNETFAFKAYGTNWRL